jgi:hypothetical protein
VHKRPHAALVTVVALVGAALPARADCPPQVQVEGAADLLASIGAALAQRGLGGPSSRADCPMVVAQVVRHEGRIAIAVTEGPRHAERVVGDEETAATFIESWARRDVAAPLWAVAEIVPPSSDPPEPPATATVTAPPAPALPSLMVTRAAPSNRPTLLVGAGFEATLGFDRQPWLGAATHLATRVGPIALGVLARAADSLQATTDSGLTYDRLMVALLARVAVPLRFGGWSLIPSVGAGVSWVRSRFSDATYHGSESGGALAGELALSVGRTLWRQLAVELTASLDGNLVTQDDGDLRGGELDVRETAERKLPALPSGMARLAIGLRWGGQ